MRSCEYSCTPIDDDQRTSTIKVENIRFYQHKQLVPTCSPDLDLSDAVLITFVDQKNSRKYDIVAMHKSTHAIHNPVLAWANTVHRFMSYPGFDQTWTVDTWFNGKTQICIKSSAILDDIKASVYYLGEDKLGFAVEDVGTDSIRSSCAMLMYLNSVPIFMIMLVRRWRSEAFLLYIQKQVLSFTAGISDRMLLEEEYSTIPDECRNDKDPAIPHNINNFAHNMSPTSAQQTSVMVSLLSNWH